MDIALLNQNYYELCKNYDLDDQNILRKFIHGLTAADACFSIANSLNFSRQEREFIYACGLLHDIGRMEQWKTYKSFSDSVTRPHEILGVEILQKGWISKFFDTVKEQELALKLVQHHTSIYYGQGKELKRFLPVLRNADNYANLQYTATGLQRLWVSKDGYTPDVLEKFQKRKNLHGTLIYTKLDRIFQFLSRTYAIDYPMLKKDLLARKYINAIYDVYSENLNKQDKSILYKECWALKKELAEQVLKYEKRKRIAIQKGEA